MLTAHAEQPVGEATQAWLVQQKSKQATRSENRPMTGEEAQRVYARYLRSLEQDVPESFGQQKRASE